MAKASIHVKRHLSPVEQKTIAVALALLLNEGATDRLAAARDAVMHYDEILNDEEIHGLTVEVMRARKVKVCRTKHKES